MLRIAITGGMGSGKSALCHKLEQRGIPVFYCDERAHYLIGEDAQVRREITLLLGSCERSLLRQFVSSGPAQAARLNSIVWPRVGELWTAFCDKALAEGAGQAVMECALLFESGYDKAADLTLLVTAPETVRLKRVCRRDNVEEEYVRRMMTLQMDEEEKRRRAHHIIENTGTVDDMLRHYDDIMRQAAPAANPSLNL